MSRIPKLGELTKMDPRSVWELEAIDFTPWLADNLDRLGSALGVELELEEAEASVGRFSLDVLAKDLTRDRTVVIENQLAGTDHTHLGQLLTYAAGFDAECVVWISTSIREEHRAALDWLNHNTGNEIEFYGVVLEVLKIGDSDPAVQFRMVAAPNSWEKERRTSRASGQASERGRQYQDFFQAMTDELYERGFTRTKTATTTNWSAFASGVSGIIYGSSFNHGGRVRAEIYIDLKNSSEENMAVLRYLQAAVPDAQSHFPEEIAWEWLESKRACRLTVYREGRIDSTQEELAKISSWMIARLELLKRLFGDHLRSAVESLADAEIGGDT